jgi:hypothetical protein
MMDESDVKRLQIFIAACMTSLEDLKKALNYLNDEDELRSDEIDYLDYVEEACLQIENLSKDFNSNSTGGPH